MEGDTPVNGHGYTAGPEGGWDIEEALPITLLIEAPTQVAFVDRDGVIRNVNRRWRDTALKVGGVEALRATSVGVDYLGVCARSAAAGDDSAAQAGRGIAAVLRLACNFFSLEYPCADSWYLMYVAPLRKSGGAVIAHLNITDRKVLEQELAIRDAWHRLVLGATSDLISTHTPDTAFVFASDACRRLLGYEPQELQGHPIWDFLHPEDLERAERTYDALTDASESEVLTYRFRRKDGSYLWVESTIRVIGRPRGKSQESWVAVTRDVTSHQEAEEAHSQLRLGLERAASDWRSTFDAIESPILLLGPERLVLRLNQAAKELHGRRADKIVGSHLLGLGRGQPWITMAALANRVLDSHIPEVCEATNESRERIWEVEATPSATSDGAESRVIVQVRDITKTVRLQESLRRSETMAALGSVVGGVAHEVRNPLFGMSAVLDAFESRFGDLPEHRPYLPLLRQELVRMTELMQDLLDYGKPARLHLGPREIADVVAGALDLCRPLAESKGVALTLGLEPALPTALVDAQQLTQAIKNVLENAIQHSPPAGEVTLEAEPITFEGSPGVRVSVRDRGPGFNPADLPRVMEPFFSRRQGGTGLGLSIVSRVLEEHGGRVRTANHSGGGAVVVLEIPCLRPPQEA